MCIVLHLNRVRGSNVHRVTLNNVSPFTMYMVLHLNRVRGSDVHRVTLNNVSPFALENWYTGFLACRIEW